MAEENAETQMIQRALVGELESDEKPTLQNIGRKRQTKSRCLLIELPELNTTLVEAFWDLDKMTRTANDMAQCSKEAHRQVKAATELWQASKNRTTELKRRLQEIGNEGKNDPQALPPPTSHH